MSWQGRLGETTVRTARRAVPTFAEFLWTQKFSERKEKIPMGEFTIKSFAELHAVVEKQQGRGFIYRGVSSTSHKLIPK